MQDSGYGGQVDVRWTESGGLGIWLGLSLPEFTP